MSTEKNTDTPVLHVLVVGFHHKKGCQVEYSYPPVIEGNPVDSHELPQEWKHLPSLALPDGAHNYQKDTVFFHMPSRDSSKRTVYCVSCYRQMDAKDLLNRTADITRSTVQKSVCVISQLPLYGLLKAKLELITHAYFDERDFSKVELLEQTFNNLNASLTESRTQVFLGLSPKDAVIRFKHKLVVLFKLLLLERRVLFFGSPVEVLGTAVLSVLSLYPGMLECGLEQAVSDGRQRLISPTMGVASLDPGDGGTGEEFVDVHFQQSPDQDSTDGKVELYEVLPHLHGGPVTAITSEPPESPTIPRDVILSTPLSGQGHGTASKEEESDQYKIITSSWSSQDSDHQPTSPAALSVSGLGVHKPCQRSSLVSEKSDKSTSRFPFSDSKQEDIDGGHSSQSTDTLISSTKHSPLEDMSSVTQISAVQTGHVLPSDQAAVESYVHSVEVTSGGLGELTLCTGSDPLLGRSDSVEELDSPESISKIDREDCFSWEEDRLQLSLAVDAEDSSTAEDRNLGHAESSPEEEELPQDQSDLAKNDAHSTEDSLASTPGSAPTPTKQSPVKKGGKQGSPGRRTAGLKNKLSTAFGKVRPKMKDTDTVEMKPLIRGEVSLQQDDFGFPLAIFTKGCICHPYVSLQFHSILSDVNVRSFVLGATNILFRQQKQVTDVVVEVEEGKLEVKDRELQKQLHLTTADLRFSELLVRQVTEQKSNVYLDGTEWEGSDEWIRAQFRSYLQSLLATMQNEDVKLLEDFGLPFITAWRTTHNYRHWLDSLPHPSMADVPAGHPFQGNLSVTDVRMRLNHSMQSTERGRKINAAVMQTGKYVMQTSKAVGGAFSSARSAVSSWFTSITNDWRHEEEEEENRERVQGDEIDEARENGVSRASPQDS